VAEVDVGAHDRFGVADLLGDPAGLPVQRNRPVQLAEVVQARPQGAEGVGLLGPGADRPCDRDRLLAIGNGL
jgi:hypothetical protein